MPRIARIDLEKFRELYDMGLSDRRMAKILGCSDYAIRYWRYKLNLPANDKHRLSEAEITAIKELNEAGFNDSEIAKIIGRPYPTIYAVRKRLGLPAVGHTCCSFRRRVKSPLKKEIVAKCGEQTRAFLRSYLQEHREVAKGEWAEAVLSEG